MEIMSAKRVNVLLESMFIDASGKNKRILKSIKRTPEDSKIDALETKIEELSAENKFAIEAIFASNFDLSLPRYSYVGCFLRNQNYDLLGCCEGLREYSRTHRHGLL